MEVTVERAKRRIADKRGRCYPNVVYRYRGDLLPEHLIQHDVFLAYRAFGGNIVDRRIAEEVFNHLHVLPAGARSQIKPGAKLRIDCERYKKPVKPFEDLCHARKKKGQLLYQSYCNNKLTLMVPFKVR